MLVFIIVILMAFWFTAENANELVWIDLAVFRIRASLPLIIFSSVLVGMGASTLVGWRADRKARLRASAAANPIEIGEITENLETNREAREAKPRP